MVNRKEVLTGPLFIAFKVAHGNLSREARRDMFFGDGSVAHRSAARLGAVLHHASRKGEVGSFLNGFVHFPLGAFIVAFHNMWHGIPMVVTIIGWGLVIKSTIYFACPRQGVRMLGTTSLERSWHFVAAGVTSVALSGLILYPLL